MNAGETEEAISALADEPVDPRESTRWRREACLTPIWQTRIALTVLLAISGVGCAARNGPDVVPEPEPLPDPIPEALRLSGTEQYPGRNGLVQKVGTSNLDGKLVILDAPADGEHAQRVKQIVINAGVPEEYVSIQENTTIMYPDGTITVPEDTKVIVRPDWPALRRHEKGEVLAKHNIIAALSAGNTFSEFGNGRDYYRPDHPVWNKFPDAADYNSVMEGLRTANGKALLATWADVQTDGSIVPVQKAVMCGDAMEWCFAVRVPNDLLSDVRNGIAGTSRAAPILGAHTFYLFQLWDTAEEVFGVLKECAFDAGDPGVDREFGLGIPTAICPTIQNREVQAAGASLTVGGGSAVVSSLLAGPGNSLSFGNRMSLSFSPSWKLPDLFVSFSSLAAGKTISVGDKTLISALAGAGYAPLGVSSSMTVPGASLFAEAGVSRELLAAGNTSLALLAAFGAETGSVSTLTGRTGAVLRHRSFSLYGGAVRTAASVAIPGHSAVGVPPAAASRSGWEVALSRSFSSDHKPRVRSK